MTGKWFEGLKDAPEGTIPDVGHSGPGVKVQGRDDAHIERIKATGFYKASSAPKEEVAEAAAEQTAPQTDAKDGAKAGK